jgi:hypothetical protein
MTLTAGLRARFRNPPAYTFWVFDTSRPLKKAGLMENGKWEMAKCSGFFHFPFTICHSGCVFQHPASGSADGRGSLTSTSSQPPQYKRRIHRRGAARRHQHREDRRGEQDHGRSDKCHRILRRHAEEHGGHNNATGEQGRPGTDRKTEHDRPQAVPHQQAQQIAWLRAHRDAHAHLARALIDDGRVDSRLTSQRFSALLLGIFAGAALLLASVGIYAVLSYIVRGRTREIGIRTALGARTADVLRMVIVEGMWPTLVFGVSASDPLTLAAVAATLAVVALMASLVPAYRALRLDPARVLRAD